MILRLYMNPTIANSRTPNHSQMILSGMRPKDMIELCLAGMNPTIFTPQKPKYAKCCSEVGVFNQSARQWFNQSVSQSVNQSINQSIIGYWMDEWSSTPRVAPVHSYHASSLKRSSDFDLPLRPHF